MENSEFFKEIKLIKSFVFNKNSDLDETFVSEIYKSKIYNSEIFKYIKIGKNIDFFALAKIENICKKENARFEIIIGILENCKDLKIDTASLILRKMIERYQREKVGLEIIRSLFKFIFKFE